ncbi:MAG: RDD family protein [Dehalobacter sp. 4CP]|uniref:RDD family protein n=1 Tax=Dehalobacter sp. CP TaxID=2594474 RepID=UPI0013CB8B74|nr:RDD family protein [Dehalobacter sp.]NBJ14334.1 RDD family protein [Dehalobacter sp. 4CP]
MDIDHITNSGDQTAESANTVESVNVVDLRVVGFWTRFWAFVIDLAVIAMSSQIFFRVIWPAGLETTTIKSFVLINALFPGIWGSIYFVLLTMYFGQTLGKMIMGIKVVSKDGSPLSWSAVAMREVAGRTLAQLLGTYLGYLICAFHPRKQALTDIIGDTYVVYAEDKKRGRWVQIPVVPSTNAE